MNRIIFQLVAVGFCFAAVGALQCYKCSLGFGSLCITSKITCDSGEHCFSGKGEAVGFVDIKKKGCLAMSKCNQTENVDFPANTNTTIYTMTKTCCNTNLCNAAPGLPATPGLSLALAAVTALFVANTLV